jgi:hypothetical protein
MNGAIHRQGRHEGLRQGRQAAVAEPRAHSSENKKSALQHGARLGWVEANRPYLRAARFKADEAEHICEALCVVTRRVVRIKIDCGGGQRAGHCQASTQQQQLSLPRSASQLTASAPSRNC